MVPFCSQDLQWTRPDFLQLAYKNTRLEYLRIYIMTDGDQAFLTLTPGSEKRSI